MAFSQHITIKQNLLRCLETLILATEYGVLLPLLVTRIVVIVTDLDGHRVVILLNASLDFLKKLFLKRFRMFQTSFCILVFCLKIGQHLRIFALVEPIVVINTGMAVHRHLMGMDGGLGGCNSVFHYLITSE